jgi:hypothetical protein
VGMVPGSKQLLTLSIYIKTHNVLTFLVMDFLVAAALSAALSSNYQGAVCVRPIALATANYESALS